MTGSGRAHRISALMIKESHQVLRDPSALLIAFVLPLLLLFLFTYAVSLDIRKLPIGVVLESDAAAAQSLAAGFTASRYFDVRPARHRQTLDSALLAGDIKGMVVISQDFSQRLERLQQPLVEVITDGSEPNTAKFVTSYTQQLVGDWLVQQTQQPALLRLQPRFWFNAEQESRKALLPGALAVIMTMIGTLLTALVIAREWERGTMEALLSTPASVTDILLGKLLPYLLLGLAAMLLSSLLAVYGLGVPLQGQWGVLLLLTMTFLVPALGQGLLISSVTRNQFLAAQVALFSGFLPALLLSGFIFEIDSMPPILRLLTHVVPARYFVESLKTIFLVGHQWSILIPDMLWMLAIGMVFFILARLRTHKRLDR